MRPCLNPQQWRVSSFIYFLFICFLSENELVLSLISIRWREGQEGCSSALIPPSAGCRKEGHPPAAAFTMEQLMPLDCASRATVTRHLRCLRFFLCPHSRTSIDAQLHDAFGIASSRACLVYPCVCNVSVCLFFLLKCFPPDFCSWTQCWLF